MATIHVGLRPAAAYYVAVRFYVSTFIVAFIVLAGALAVALAPEIRQLLMRFRRPLQTERHLVRREEEKGPRPPRPKLRREMRAEAAAPDEEASPPA